MDDTLRFGIWFAVMAYSCIIHECAHVWVAWRLGDPTGVREGRLTLNPIPHIDLFSTIILPVLTYLLAGFPIAGPKPAPVNPLNFRNPRAGSMWTAVAGPASNLLLAGLGLGLLWTLRTALPDWVRADSEVSINAHFFSCVIFQNVLLAACNLIPVPPLDGSRFLQFVLGESSDAILGWIERLGPIAIFIAFYYVAPLAVHPVMRGLVGILAQLFGPEYASPLVHTFFRR